MVAGNKTAVEAEGKRSEGKSNGSRLAKFVKRAGKKLARIPVYIYRPEVLLSRVTTFLTTGIPELDEALGGGLPVGRFVEIFGDESVGKSALLHLIISLMHKRFPKSEAMLADTETAMDDRRVQSYRPVGLDLSRLAYTTPTTMEEFFDILDLYLDDRIEAIEVGVKVGDKLVKQDLEPAIVGLDSIATTPPKSCMDRETMDKATVAAQARALSDGLRQVNNKLARARVLFVAVNQNRTKVGVYAPMGVTPTDSPGGKAPKFYATIRIKLKNTEPIPKSGSPRLGTFVQASTVKNKLTPPKQSVEFVLDYSCGISPEYTLFHNLLRKKKVRPQGGGKYALSWAKSKPFARSDFPAMLAADPELKQKCTDKLRESAEPEEKTDDD